MGIGSNKEGFSVFGVLNKCVTSMGRRLLRLWFTRPIIDLHALNDRQDAIQARHSCLPASWGFLLSSRNDVTRRIIISGRHMLDRMLSCIIEQLHAALHAGTTVCNLLVLHHQLLSCQNIPH